MIFLIIACLSAGAAIGFITAALLQAGSDRTTDQPHTEPTKLLTVAVHESQGDGEIILRRTMAAVEELEVSE